MGSINSTRKKAAALGIVAMVLCFAWGAWAQGSADPADADDPADSTDVVDVDVPADSTDLVDVDDPADSTDLADVDVPADSTDLADVDVPADSTDLADVDDSTDSTAAPVIAIVKQPAAAVTVTLGGIADTLKIEARVTGGATLSYQWYGVINSGDGILVPYEAIAIDGATSAKFAIPADLDTGTYLYYCVVSATNGAVSVQSDVAAVTVEIPTSIASADRVIPSSNPGKVAVISPIAALTVEFTAGPNPVARQSGGVSFFRDGKSIGNAALYVYDASGNFVRKIGISDNSAGGLGKRVVGAWDLRDSKGRLVSEGSYVVKGVISTKAGTREKVSLIIGVI